MSITTPDPIVTNTVFGYVFDDDGVTPIVGATVTFTSVPFQVNDNAVAINEPAITDSEGRYQATLPETVTPGILVEVQISYADLDGRVQRLPEHIVIPVSPSPISVQDARAQFVDGKIVTQVPVAGGGSANLDENLLLFVQVFS